MSEDDTLLVAHYMQAKGQAAVSEGALPLGIKIQRGNTTPKWNPSFDNVMINLTVMISKLSDDVKQLENKIAECVLRVVIRHTSLSCAHAFALEIHSYKPSCTCAEF